MIYCSHRYGGLEENKRICEAKVKALQLADLENTYVSPIHALGFMRDVVSYEHEAARSLGVSASNISSVCKGKHAHTKGYVFRYADDSKEYKSPFGG